MPYNIQPKTFYSDVDLSNTEVEIKAVGTVGRFSWGVLTGGAAIEQVIFQSAAGTPVEYFRILVPAGQIVQLQGFEVSNGLELVCGSAAGDVGYALFEVTP